jgi:hypothetical protein
LIEPRFQDSLSSRLTFINTMCSSFGLPSALALTDTMPAEHQWANIKARITNATQIFKTATLVNDRY